MSAKHISIILLILATAILAVAKSPDKEAVKYNCMRGAEAVSEENYSEASEFFSKALDESPKEAQAHIGMALCYFNTNNPGEALNSTNNALKYASKKDNETRLAALNLRGAIYLQLGDSLSALDDFSKMVNIDPKSVDGYVKRGQLLFDLKRYDESDADYRRITSLSPGSTLGYMGLGRNALRCNHLSEAIANFDKAAKLDPAFSTALAFRGEAYMAAGDYNRAADDLVEALAIDNSSKAYYQMLEMPEKGLPALRARLTAKMLKEPTNVSWYYNLASLDEHTEFYDEAVANYLKANDVDANSIFLERAATCRWCQHRPKAALALLNRAMAINAEDDDLIMERATINEALGLYDQALADLSNYIGLHPEEAQNYAHRAWIKIITGDYTGAFSDINMALTLEPEGVSHHIRRGRLYNLTGKTDEARSDFERALELNSADGKPVYESQVIAAGYLGRRQEVLAAIDSMRAEADTLSKPEARMPKYYNMACGYALLAEADSAIALLQRTADTDYVNAFDLSVDPDLASLRSDSRFVALIDSLKAAQDEPYDPAFAAVDSVEAVEAADTVAIPFTKENGVTKVQCSINGLPLYFVFDTGASDVTISMVEANFMVKNGYVKPADVIGTTRYMDANGNVSEGTVINLREVDFGGLHLDNVRASVVRNQKAPLLLGQSVLGRLGKIEINNRSNLLLITPS